MSNNGSGALTLTGAVSAPGSLTLGGSYAATDNTVSGVISGAGTLISNGAGTWVLTGANTRSGAVTVQNGTLRAGSAQALGTVTGVTVNGGTLDLNDFSLTAQSLTGTGGTLCARQRHADAEQRPGTHDLCGQHHRQRRPDQARLEHADADRRQHLHRRRRRSAAARWR